MSEETQNLLTDDDEDEEEENEISEKQKSLALSVEFLSDVFEFDDNFPRVYVHGSRRYNFPGKEMRNFGNEFENLAKISSNLKPENSNQVEIARKATRNEEILISPQSHNYQQLKSDSSSDEESKWLVFTKPKTKKKTRFVMDYKSNYSPYFFGLPRNDEHDIERMPKNDEDDIERIIRNLRKIKHKVKNYQKNYGI